MKLVHLETDRLILRPIVVSDTHDLFELDADPEVHRYLGNEPLSHINQIAPIIEHIQRQYESVGYGRLAVTLKSDGSFLGWSGLKYETGVRSFPYVDLGYRFKRSCWGNGYATESAEASLDWGFTNLNTDIICAATELENKASVNILSKLQFSEKETFTFESKPHRWFELAKHNWKSFKS